MTAERFTPPFLDDSGELIPDSVAEIAQIQLGGLEQTVIIRGISDQRPVLLFIHGGPGTAEFNLLRQCCPDIEKVFMVAHWEQRGSGLSFSSDIPPESMNIEQLVEDAAELSSYLSERFNQEKIFVMGHSWGSYLGARLVHKYPALFKAFIGFGQITDFVRSEQISYDWVVTKLREIKDQENVETMLAIPRPSTEYQTNEEWRRYLSLHRPLCQKLGGGNSHYEEWDDEKIIRLYDETPEYGKSGAEKVLLPGLNFTLKYLIQELYTANLFNDHTDFKLPVFILNGRHDYQTTHQLAYEYYQAISAPVKRFVTFELSAHTPFYDEPERFIEVVQEILNEVQSLD